jgi:hypothetical protein
MKIITTIGIIAVLLLAANVSSTQTLQTNAGAGSDSDPAIVEKLREIVSIYQRMAEANERAVRSGRGETDGRYELALAKARLQLARELGQHNDQIAALKDAHNAQQRRLEDAKARAAVGAASPEDVDSIRVAVLKAEVRLLRAQNSTKRQ